ncbi:hypothetical protein VTO42DRAFT_4590 [Malbranchea cinnamomea]
MAGRFASRRNLRPLLYTTAVVAVAGGGYLYYSRRPHSNPLSDRPVPRSPSQIHFPRLKSRDEHIADLKRSGAALTHTTDSEAPGRQLVKSADAASNDEYDLVIIGGGATGTGIALDAVTRGFKVALVERDDFSSGTSSKSTKLVHGGVRYLEKAVWNLDYNQYKLVKEALRERKYFLDIAPHLSSWLPTLIPIRKWWEAPYLWAGTKLYDILAGAEGPEGSYYLSKHKTMNAFPTLDSSKLVGALVYHDGQHNDSRMNISLAVTAALYGATVVNHMEVTSLEKDSNGKIRGVRVRDRAGSGNDVDEFVVRAKGVINATGPFSDSIRKMDEPTGSGIVAPSSGVHVILPGWLGPKNMGLIEPSSDGRVIFLLPWEGNLLAGTTDNACQVTQNPVPKEQEINWVLNEVRRLVAPEADLQRSDVLAAWSGIRPLVQDPNATGTEGLVRSHLVTVSKSGLLTCAGGKWTTYREMAEDAVNKAVEVFQLQPRMSGKLPDISGIGLGHTKPLDGSCQTQNLLLVGAHGFSRTLFIDLIKHYGLDADVARHLARSYGDRAWEVARLSSSDTSDDAQQQAHQKRLSPAYPYLEGEVRYAVKNEYALTAADFLSRRTRLAFLDTQAALEALPKVIDLMGEELHWNQAKKESEWTETVKFLTSMGLPESMQSVTREQVLSGSVKIGTRNRPWSDPVKSKPEKESSPGLAIESPASSYQ